jgi:hypothetical protein
MIRVADGEEDHDLLSTIAVCLVELLRVFTLHVPLSPDSRCCQVSLASGPHHKKRGPLWLNDWTGLSSTCRTSLEVISPTGGISRFFFLAFGDLVPWLNSRKSLQLMLTVGKVTAISKRAVTLQVVFTETDFEELVRFWCRASRCYSILGLHLTQAQGEVCHCWQIYSISADVFVSTKGSVNAEPLRVKYALESVGIANMPKGTIFNLTVITVTTKRHFRKVVLMQELTGCSLHAKITQPMATYDST